jgi:hypothetical protein
MSEALARLLRIRPSTDYRFDVIHKRLLQEYFRRMRLWYLVFKPDEHWAFFDVAACIAPSVRASDETIQILDEKILLPWAARNICRWYLHWDALKAAKVSVPFDLPEPHEPAIRVLESGCIFTTEHGYIDLGSSSSFYYANSQQFDRETPFIDIEERGL